METTNKASVPGTWALVRLLLDNCYQQCISAPCAKKDLETRALYRELERALKTWSLYLQTCCQSNIWNRAECNQISPLCITLQQTGKPQALLYFPCSVYTQKHGSFWGYTNERHIVLFYIKMVYYSWLKCFPETVAECWMNKGLLGADGHVSVVMDMALQALSSTLRLQEHPQHSLIFLAWFIKGHSVISSGMGFEFLSAKSCGLCSWWMFDCMRKFNWTCSVVVSIGCG